MDPDLLGNLLDQHAAALELFAAMGDVRKTWTRTLEMLIPAMARGDQPMHSDVTCRHGRKTRRIQFYCSRYASCSRPLM